MKVITRVPAAELTWVTGDDGESPPHSMKVSA
jgi:hypothetical protein